MTKQDAIVLDYMNGKATAIITDTMAGVSFDINYIMETPAEEVEAVRAAIKADLIAKGLITE